MRKARGFTQIAFAKAIRVSRGVITNIEYGKAEPSPIVLAAICSTLNINEQWLLTGEGPIEMNNVRSKMLDELYQVCAKLTEPQQKHLLAYIDILQKHDRLMQIENEPTEKRETQALMDMLNNAESRKTAKPPGHGRSGTDREI